MSLLSGKAKEDFEKWARYDKYTEAKIDSNLINCSFNSEYYKKITKNSLIIEWLDSVGIYIQVGAISTNGIPIFDYNIQEDNTINGMNGHHFGTRQQATEESIKQANKIYNER